MPRWNGSRSGAPTFAGWQLGSRPKGDPECDAVRNASEARLIIRAEVTALIGLLIDKGVFTLDEFTAKLDAEADLLCMALEDRWPGVTATDIGLSYDLERVLPWMQGWKL